jgi:hypothetical protein
VTIVQRSCQNFHSLDQTKRKSTDIIAPSFVGLALWRSALAITSEWKRLISNNHKKN